MTNTDAKLALKNIIMEYRLKNYEELANMADANFSTTEHPLGEDGVQIGICVFYDDRAIKSIRCSFSLYDVHSQGKWWRFWDSPTINSGFIITKDGRLL